MKRMLGRAACRQSEIQYRDFCENTDTLIQHVTPDGRFLYVNPAWQRVLGYAEDDISELSVFRLLHPQCPPAHLDLFRQVLRGERARACVETLFRTRAGNALPVAGNLTGQWVNGRVVGMLGFFQDLSTSRGRGQDSADSLAMFLHDLKNPMSAILGYTQLLCEQAQEEGLPHITKMLYRIETNVRSLCALVGNYLHQTTEGGEQQSLQLTPVAINVLLRRILQQYEVEAQARCLSLQAWLQEGLPLIMGDAVGLERVFTNLLHNALKFTPPYGRILVQSEQRDRAVAVHISDTGPGISPAELPFIFGKYWQGTVHRQREGVGLGLFIVKTLVEAHGGHVQATNNPGAGACFSVFLPLCSSLYQASSAPSSDEEGGVALTQWGA